MGAYTLTALLGAVAYAKGPNAIQRLWMIVVGCIFWSILMEFVQLLMATGRHFEVLDIIANIIGCFAGVAAYRIFKQRHYGS
jgi:VanZ family protein